MLDRLLSVVLILSNTREVLTTQMHVHLFLSMVLISLEKNLQPGCSLISGSDPVKHWKGTHMLDACYQFLSVVLIQPVSNTEGTHTLDACSPVLISGSDSAKHWRGMHTLDVCSPVLVSGSDTVKHWRGTHMLDPCSPVLVSGSDPVTGQGLTPWIHVHPLSSEILVPPNTGEALTS